ncbi:MAG: DUF502 domain-containing protein [Chlamydiae bacterium]|nr:DUF502 domain-containing protein [Chlamydiota bacterium]
MKKHAITGIIILTPLVLTIVVIGFIVNFLTRPFINLVSSLLTKYEIINRGFLFLSPEKTLKYGSELLILLAIFFFIWLVGFLAKKFFIDWIIQKVDLLMHKVPVANSIYKTSKEVIHNIFSDEKPSFKQVVVVPFPGKGIYVLGFLTNQAPLSACEATNQDLLSVFIPTTPNPTTGFLLMYQREHVRKIDMSVETAIKYIVSCGLIAKMDDKGAQQ